jgi:hypothetical protein
MEQPTPYESPKVEDVGSDGMPLSTAPQASTT